MIVEPSEYFLLISSFLLSAFYSGAEAALISIPVDRSEQIVEEGGRRVKAFKFLLEKPNAILTTILVGNNFVNIFAASLATTIAHRYFEDNGVAVSVGVMTFLILIFGEIIPKTIARTHSEKLAFYIIQILRINYFIIFPVIWPLSKFITRLLGKNARLTGRSVTKDDIEYMINKADEAQSIDSKHIDLLTSILEFPMIKVKDVMVNRQRVVLIQSDATFKEMISIIKPDTHSRYPVCEGELDNAIGFLHVKDLVFVEEINNGLFNISKYLKPPFFVYEHMKIQSVFDLMNRRKVHLALVKDENGLVVGIITLEDIIEEILGEITDEHDDEEIIDTQSEEDVQSKGLFVEGEISLRDLYNEYDVKIPLSDNYSTLRGFLLDKLGDNFPKQNDIVSWKEYTFELISVSDFEIMEVKVKEKESEEDSSQGYTE